MSLKFPPHFPGQVIAGPGIDVDEDYVVSTDYSEFPFVSPYTPQSTHYALVYDSTTGAFFLVPANSFGG